MKKYLCRIYMISITPSTKKSFSSLNNTVYLGIGSNLGNKISNFNKTYHLISKFGKIEKTSQIYSSPCLDEEGKIVKEENTFINAVLKLKTNLSPLDLLHKIKKIESLFKRRPKQKYYEAREIDIDILTYNNELININEDTTNYTTTHLNIPHIRITDRLFVLKPLLDIDNNLMIINRENGELISVQFLLEKLLKNKYSVDENKIKKLVKKDKIIYLDKILQHNPNTCINLSEKGCLLMGVFNCTPDSFSGGLLNKYENYDKIIEILLKNKNYIDIIDIGGESTRPGAKEVPQEIELERVATLLTKIKSNEELNDKIISIDTRKSFVANECLKLGADIINDVSGGDFDENMFNVISQNSAVYILMHSRGLPENMFKNKYTTYTQDLITEIFEEIENKLQKCRDVNIPDWNIIIDPGIGFAKNSQQNFEILQNIKKFKQKFSNLLLIGHSKKKFIREVLDNCTPDETLIGDVVISSHAISQGANILRVHNYKEIYNTIKISKKLLNN